MLVTKKVTIFAHLEIRDTVSHYSSEYLDLSKAKHWAFEIKNTLNQAITVYLIGGSGRGRIGSSVSIAANSVEPVATDIWMNIISLELVCATAPTSGNVLVTGEMQIEE